MGLRAGFFGGFLVGAVAAALMPKAPPAAPSGSGEGAGGEPSVTIHPAIDMVRGYAREAMKAAREAANQKELEMRRSFEESIKHGHNGA